MDLLCPVPVVSLEPPTFGRGSRIRRWGLCEGRYGGGVKVGVGLF